MEDLFGVFKSSFIDKFRLKPPQKKNMGLVSYDG